MTNVCFLGRPEAGPEQWVLVDAGLANSADRIRRVSQERFGYDGRPRAIVLTHGHFDHVGAVLELADFWEVPVFAHPLEAPYLTGKRDYPPPDPSVGSGLVARLSPLFPRKGIDLGVRLHMLPADGRIPGLSDWRWIHTPGHTPGHVSLFRAGDRILIAGDAIVTERNGPPAYFTSDRLAAKESVRLIESLNPALVVAGHGQPMHGQGLTQHLEDLAADFDRLALPEHRKHLPDTGLERKGSHP